MKTIVSTSIKSVGSFEVEESLEDILMELNTKNPFIQLNRVSHSKSVYPILVRKTVIKVVKEQKTSSI